jgi:hypothetical protein
MMPENGVSTLANAANNMVAFPTFFLIFASTKFFFSQFVLTIPCYWFFPKFSNFVRTANESKVSWVDFGKFKEITLDYPQQDTL